jgi:hypothetical protein
MIPFQIIVVSLCVVLTWSSLSRAFKAPSRRRVAVVSCLVWLAAAVCVLRPQILTGLAVILGIGRGADLVFYICAIAFLILAFYGHNRLQQVEAALTQVVRHVALANAQTKGAPGAANNVEAKPSLLA